MADIRVLPSRTAYSMPGELGARIVGGDGHYLLDSDGTRYLDASCGSGSLIFGHGDKEIIDALYAQSRKLTLFPSRHFSSEIVERYAGRLLDFGPPGMSRAITFSSGSDAVEASLKLAIQHHFAAERPQRRKILGRNASYHGNTIAGLSAGGFVARRKPYESVLAPCAKASHAHCVACEFGVQAETCGVQCAQSIEDAILEEGPENVAAVIVEPIVGAALSAGPPDPRYLPRISEICRQYDILLILDEVMTCFARTGTPFACMHWNVEPDIVVCGKAISAGYYPLSAILVNDRVVRGPLARDKYFQNGQTFACSPAGAAVGLAVLDRLADGSVAANVARMGELLRASLRKELPSVLVDRVRGMGLMVGFDIGNRFKSSRTPSSDGFGDRFQRAALKRGLVIYASSGGAERETGDHAMLLLPLTISEREVQEATACLVAAANDLLETESKARP
ncbi:aspartate aminotransferase family protein [Bradyrhizobium cajani]|uniref:Aminotransferase class III-fold pyridoxal phosphate-dependent enzyme n=1 Tax=Bradyrhizobium cajani TaxID=1928661 RepID=A0A844T5T4_9BRAD|nr:aminotransferase class III-fold pyridoxal phosphate-dependent enzyme [Bradyrhizobium cajani]MCP3368608.1 aminotransferase class III-fold pyridoxal phosphate-dependent enzyme [Bradyrhizobium cajani]MVT73596.1 aminotransferase class III-fold pyridoxal phosphate-dependent enzyme [Bradyrhizobium cajani]